MKTLTIAIISFCAVAFSSCNKESILRVKGLGESVSKTNNASSFDRIALSIDANVDYMQGSAYYAEVYAQSDIHDKLSIGSRINLRNYDAIRITAHSPSLYGIDASSSGSVKPASLNAQHLKADLSGAGNVTLSGGLLTW